jgi:putative NADH-flavin reductase
MKLAIIGANGHIGRRLVQEALNRGHEVTAIVRDPAKVGQTHDHLRVVKGDALQPENIQAAASGHDALISAYSPGFGPGFDQSNLSKVAHNLIRVVKEAHIPRLLIVGGAGSLEVKPGLRLFDSPEFPDAAREHARAQGDALAVYRASDIDWTYLSPARDIKPGTRTGKYRTGGDQVLVDAEGNSRISTEDYAVALIDEVEHPRFVRQRFTVAY